LETVLMNTPEPLIRPVETPRLVLEPQVAAHADEMFIVLSDPAIYEFENAPPASVEALRERYRALEARRSPDGRQLWLNWTVRLKEGDVAIGYVQATVLPDAAALVAYEFNSAWWGRGLAQEAVAAAMREMRQHLGVTRFGAVFKTANERSRRLLARLGMRPAAGGQFPSDLVEAGESAMTIGP
jgi:RimJ/RimL family protein N-acetyltransferase